MKRILLLFSALMLSCIALWAHDVVIDGIYYNLDGTNKTAEVTYRGNVYDDYDDEYSGSVTIPETITCNSEIYSVTSIGSEAFYKCTGLTEVTIPNSVTYIGNFAFQRCSGLTEVTIPNSVTYIGYYAFSNTGIDNNNSNWDNGVLYIDNCLIEANSDVVKGSYTIKKGTRIIGSSAFSFCSGLTSVTIPNSVTSIGSSAFEGCSGLTSVTIPNSVTSIGGVAFANCSGLTSVTIPNSVTSISSYAFSNCSGLTSVTIPNSVTSIGSDAFEFCSGLTKVNYLGTVDKWVEIDFDGYDSNPTYYAEDLYINNELLTDVKITTADSIKNYAFYNCQSIKSVEIGESVTSIGSYAFSGCSGLTSITIPNSVTSIVFSAFSGCSGLTSVTIPNSVTSIGDRAFYYCSELTSVSIPNSVTSIGGSAFEGCSGLTSITIPNSVTSIGDKAFSGCSGLTSVIWNAKNYKDCSSSTYSPFDDIRSSLTSFTFGNEIEHIPAYLCYGMSKLTEMTIPNSVTSIGKSAFSGCSGLTSVTIPNSVTSISSYAFSSCSGLTSVTIPNSVTSISSYAFSSCSGLTSVTIPNSVTSISSYAFSSCSGLISITIPNSVTSIGQYAFKSCSGLTSVIWNAKNYKDFEDYDETPFYNIRSSITSFTFGNEVEHIPAYLCYGMSKLSEVTIPNSVTYIGGDAFEGCSELTSVTIPNSVTYIGDWAFNNCSGLTSITIPNSVTSIGQYAFKSCSGLTSVIWNAKNYKDFEDYDETPFYNIRSSITSFTFGNEVEHIPAYLCYYMNNLKEVTIGKSVTSIGEDAFYNCSGLTKVIYLGTVDKWVDIDFDDYDSNPTYYAKDLYINNELLTDVKITTADSIKNYAFYNCQSIKYVEIGNSVTSIGGDAFSGCSGLTKVNYLGTVDKWVEFDFDDYDSNPTYYAKDLCINNELLADVKITTADSIKNYAFYNCQSIKSVEIGESVTSIGYSAFYGCDKLRKVTAYPTTVPSVYENSFAHYNAALYVPCDVYDDYFFDDVFGTFKVTECIAAEEVDAPDKVEIEVDEDNNAIVIWPSTDGAKKYELEISKDGEVFCTLLFNENGQLTSIDFGNRSASVGFQFTVTGLDSASKYAYSMVAMDKTGNELQSYKGTFTTNGYVPGPGEEDEPTSITETLADANITVSGGKISAEADFSIYNTIGQDVTAFNGGLQPGVYLVSIENDIVKVMVH